VWDTETGNLLLSFDGHASRLRSLAFSPDGRIIAGSLFHKDGSGCVRLCDSASGAHLRTFDTEQGFYKRFSFGRDFFRYQKCVAFAMGHHERLGAGSRVHGLEPEVVRMVLEAVDGELCACDAKGASAAFPLGEDEEDSWSESSRGESEEDGSGGEEEEEEEEDEDDGDDGE